MQVGGGGHPAHWPHRYKPLEEPMTTAAACCCCLLPAPPAHLCMPRLQQRCQW
jgi:hypothetical protein